MEDNYFIFELLDTLSLFHAGVALFAAGSQWNAGTKPLREIEPEPSVEPEWTETHESVGTDVAKYFPCDALTDGAVIVGQTSTKKAPKYHKLYRGVVTKFAPCQAAGYQFYHIVFSDGDEEDWLPKELKEGVRLFEKK